ncbi:hypothetical protein AR457_37640 [Streptomyces agglomeratus]|nr:hypothetical protein AR457_37640 [Streptomyces agglomeratus]
MTAGCCLATDQELREARDSAERGNWSHARRLPGSYVAIVRSHRTLRIVGDRAGTHTVYWCQDGTHVLWSTSALVLAAWAGSQPDLARLLAGMSLLGVDHLNEASYFQGVNRVPPGRALVLEPGRPPRTEATARQAALRFAEGASVLAQELTTAISRRAALGMPVSADMSGGVDSSSLASLAAARTPITAVTYKDRLLSEQDDVRYARRVAGRFETLTYVEVDGTSERVHHFDLLDQAALLPVTDIPSLSLGLLAIKRAQLAPAVAYGSRVHLTGRGGDNVLDSIPMTVLDQARGGRRRAALGSLASYARARRAPVHGVLRQAARTVRTPYPRALTALARELADNAPVSGRAYLGPADLLAWCRQLPAAGWLTTAGRRQVAEIVTERAVTATPQTLPGAEHERIALELMGAEHATYDDIARQCWGLPVHAPFLDGRVVDACLAVPGWQRWVPGDFKPLARAALTGTAVPDFLLQRRTKTPMTGSLHLGLRKNAPTLRAILAGSRLAYAGLVDPTPALAALDSAGRGELAPLGSLHCLLVTELWLATLSLDRDHWWETAPAPVRKGTS